MRSQAVYPLVLSLSIMCGFLAFSTIYFYTQYTNTQSEKNIPNISNATFRLEVTNIDAQSRWIEGTVENKTNKKHDRIRVGILPNAYIFTRIPRIENGVVVGYSSYKRSSISDLSVGTTIYTNYSLSAEGFPQASVIIIEK